MPSPHHAIFSRLHAELLKPLGFRRVSTRSELARPPIHQAVVCFASRFNSPLDIDFNIELRVGHEDYFHLYQPSKVFPGLGEKSFGPLLSWRLTEAESGFDKCWHITGTDESGRIEEEVLQAIRTQGLPDLAETSTVEGIVEFCRRRPLVSSFKPLTWALFHLGHTSEAHALVHEAIRAAPHENARKYAQLWLAKIGG